MRVFGRRRVMIAVLTMAAVVLALAEPSSLPLGVSTTTNLLASTAIVADPPPARGTTVIATLNDDGTQMSNYPDVAPQISGDGQWQLFGQDSSGGFGDSPPDPLDPDSYVYRMFVRNMDPNAPALHRTIQVSIGNSDLSGASLGDTVTPDGTGPDSYSQQGSISANGRYVSFVTYSRNIVPTPSTSGAVISLVVCDRDPDGDGVYDEVVPNDNAPTGQTRDYRCRGIVSTLQNAQGGVDLDSTPQLSPDGSQIVYASPNDVGGTFVWVAKVSGSNGLLTAAQAGSPTQVKGIGNKSIDSEPAFASNNYVVMRSEVAGGNPNDGTQTIVRTSLANPQVVTRVDTDPANSSNFLGDRVFGCDTTTCHVTIDAPEISADGNTALFHYGGEDLPAGSFGRMVLVRNVGTAAQASEIISRDNDGNVVDSEMGALSGNGRYVAFVHAPDTNTHDGTPNGTNFAEQIVERDVVVDLERQQAGAPRLKGALVTADAQATCTPNPPALYCASQDDADIESGFYDQAMSLSDNGSRIGFVSDQRDLVPGDGDTTGDLNGEGDVFVRTWQPQLSFGSIDFGDVEIGTESTRQVPVTVNGFGPAILGSALIGDPGTDSFTAGASTCQNAVVFTGESCVIAVTASPVAPGTRTATVSIRTGPEGSPAQVATVSVNGVESGGTPAPDSDNTRTSVRDDGSQSPSGGRSSMISGNGRWQVFESQSNLAGHTPIDPNDDGHSNIFVRDLADPEHTLQISLHLNVGADSSQPSRPISVKNHPTGASPNGRSFSPSISADGRFVSFITLATDIVPMDPVAGDVPADFVLVVCDRDPSGTVDEAGNPVLDLVRPGTTAPNYVCFAVQTGLFGADAGPSLDQSSTPRLSGDGTRITWINDIPSRDAERAVVSTVSQVGGPLQAPTPPRLVPINGVNGFTASAKFADFADALQSNPRLTRDGSAVVFDAATPCCPVENHTAVIRTTLAGGASVRFDVDPSGAGFLGTTDGDFSPPAISDDGSRVAFAYREPEGSFSVYVATQVGTTITSRIESRNNRGAVSAGDQPALSGDGRYLAFQTSRAIESNAIDPPTGQCFVGGTDTGVNCQVVARDLVEDEAFFRGDQPWTPSQIVSSSLSTDCPDPLPVDVKCGANGFSANPSIDETGSEIGFDSDSSDIVPDDLNTDSCEGPCTDSFVHAWRPVLTATPSFDFGTRELGAHRDRTFSLTLSGFGPISLGPAAISGLNPADFTVRTDGCAGLTMHETDPPCTFKLRFAPTAVGARSATLAYPVGKNGYPRISPDGTSHDPAFLAALTGVGKGSGLLTPDPTTIDFGSRLPLAPGLTKTVTVTNTGAGTIIITDVTVQDTTRPGASGDYTVNATDCLGVLAPGASCVVEVTFVGHKTGRRDAQLVIDDSVSPDPTLIGLLALVPKPTILINPGVTPPGRVTTVTGKGFAPNQVVEVTLKGFAEHVKVQADGHGKFSVGLVIFRSTPEGPQTVLAQTQGADPSIAAKNPLLIAVGSVDDLGLLTRH